jgi:hypothetical protein
MFDQNKFDLAVGNKKTKGNDAARLVLCFGMNQNEAAKTFGITQQTVSKAANNIGKRITRHEQAFSYLCQATGVAQDNKMAYAAFIEAVRLAK